MRESTITILGPTASGKTEIACHLAVQINGEIISADSRQVYKGMDIGTGKDIEEYQVNGTPIPYHLIDIAEAGTEYNLFKFITLTHEILPQIIERKHIPIICGGTGLYIHALIKGYQLTQVDPDEELRKELAKLSLNELVDILKSKVPVHNITDTESRPRVVRAIEIAMAQEKNKALYPPVDSLVFGIDLPRELVRSRITSRLESRLKNGMIDEVQNLINKGVETEQLIRYGLEYKFITYYLKNEITYQEMFDLLNIAIHQFSKRQMTWFRKMEKEGVTINWIDGTLTTKQKIEFILNKIP